MASYFLDSQAVNSIFWDILLNGRIPIMVTLLPAQMIVLLGTMGIIAHRSGCAIKRFVNL